MRKFRLTVSIIQMRDDLQAKSIQIARLVTDLEAAKQSGSFNPDDVSAFSKLVEPIVEEYERLIQALEGKLQATLASLVSGKD